MIEKYSIESIKNILPYELDVEIRDYDVYLTIDDDFRIYFQQIYQYHLFCFVIKRANDFGIIPNNPEFNIGDLKQYIALDNKLNIIVTADTPDFQKGSFSKKIGTYLKTGEYAFWGNIVEEELYIMVGDKYIKKPFANKETEKFTTKVLVQPDNYDESYIVYIDSEFKSKEPMRVVITLKKNKDEYIFTGIVKSDWIY